VSERNDSGGRSGRQPAEGVRIIRAEEAQAALDAGEAAGRRPDDQLRFGDVPPVPSGPRPAHRFPLPDSVDPAEAVSLPPLASPRRSSDAASWRASTPQPPDPAQEPPDPGHRANQDPGHRADKDPGHRADKDPGHRANQDPGHRADKDPGHRANRDPDETGQVDVPESARPKIQANPAGESVGSARPARPPAAPPPPAPEPTSSPGWNLEPEAGWDPGDRTTEMDAPGPSVPLQGITVTGSTPDMPHWTDPPTGEVPRLRIEDDAEEGDDLEAWRALGSRGVRWRDENDWDDAEEIRDVVGDVEPVGALDSSRSERSDIYSFDEDFERVTSRTGAHPAIDFSDDAEDGEVEPELAVAPAGTRRQTRQGRQSRAGRPVREPARLSPDQERAPRRPGPPRTPPPTASSDVGGRVLVGAVLIALLIICYAIGAKALVVLAGVVIVAAAAEAYGMLRGAGFRPATLLGLIATAGLIGATYWKGIEAIPIVTVLLFAGAMMWYVLGIVEARPLANVAVTVMVFVWVGVLGAFAPVMLAVKHGQGEFLGAVVVAVAADICAFAVGRFFGSRPIAAHISPNKTVEGFFGGLLGAVIVGLIVGKELTPWGGMKHGLLLGIVIGIIAPAGDLFESMMKRDLGIKDSGHVLAGHGGLLDRFDSILLALPAAYFVVTWFKL
jgi:phosphatidate cytidylyltransferase